MKSSNVDNISIYPEQEHVEGEITHPEVNLLPGTCGGNALYMGEVHLKGFLTEILLF